MALNLPALVPAAAFLGLVSHLAYFINGEHHMEAMGLFQAALFLPPAMTAGLVYLTDSTVVEAAKIVALLLAAYLTPLFTSMLLYRVFFHRLRRYPGPFSAKLSKLWHVSKLSNKDNHKQLQTWHAKYGEYVRTGPTELSIADPDAVELIYGPRTRCTKAPWYDISMPLVSMHQNRNKAEHDRRRRSAWDKGFGAKALRDYEPRVVNYADLLVSQISTFAGAPLNASRWMNYYSFDVMGDLAFGKSFDMLKNGQSHFAIDLLNKAQGAFGLLSPAVWVFRILTRMPIISADYKAFVAWCENQMIERTKMKVEKPDIAHWLINSPPMSSDPFVNRMWAAGDSRLIIVGGSDTTAATLTFLFHYLAKNPAEIEKLRKELEGVVVNANETLQAALRDLPHLNGAINEALRLNPPVPSGLQRMTPPEGMDVGGKRVPGLVTVFVPSYVMGRSEECYERPYDFVPERWYSRPEMVKRKDAFIPFSSGAYSCIGKQLALQEVRTVTAKLITKFDVSFAPGEDGSTLLEESKDIFTTELGDMFLCFKLRKQE
ncbi:putative P450 monooxygenase [Lophium mytilinum]|uniref:Putative P450 monooxygenase n=1 Tax=Lophium mytilinum TaxID=390894 RepID=A0A6A6RDU9_9PEZI|nr:putative P450 monooxygenase [Lophium mytilinum]